MTAGGQSRRSGRHGRARKPPFQDRRPLRGDPVFDPLLIALTGLLGGLLRGEGVFAEPAAEVVRVVMDAEAFADQLHDPGRGPEVGAEAEVGGVAREPQTDLVFLERRELRLGAGMRAELETVFALIAIPLHPRPDAAVRDLQRRRHRGVRLALQNPLHREPTAIFLRLRVRDTANQIRNRWRGRSCRDHAQRMATAFPESSGLKRTPAP